MKRAAVYSSSRRQAAGIDEPAAPAPPGPSSGPSFSLQKLGRTQGRALRIGAVLLAALVLAAGWWRYSSQGDPLPAEPALAAEQPSPAEAYEKIRRSVVLVRGFGDESEKPRKEKKGERRADKKGEEPEGSVGSGVVIVDTGLILTNVHVVHGAKRIKVTFADGLESDAEVVGTRPEHDLAVLQAKTLPDDLEAATMRSTAGLRPGDAVVAVGFPFGIGPSASSGVISGLARDYRTATGRRLLTNLIQFDAAANPGNSGGPLVTLDGQVIGIVTAILNPTEQRVFIGIGFAVPIENAAAAAGLNPF